MGEIRRCAVKPLSETSLKRESLQGDRVKGLRSSPLAVIAATEWGGLGRYWRGASTYNFILLKPHGSWNNCRPHGLGWLREIAARSRITNLRMRVHVRVLRGGRTCAPGETFVKRCMPHANAMSYLGAGTGILCVCVLFALLFAIAHA